MQVKKQQFEHYMKQWTGSIYGKEYIKAIYCHSVYLTFFFLNPLDVSLFFIFFLNFILFLNFTFNLYAAYIMQNPRLDELQARINCWET